MTISVNINDSPYNGDPYARSWFLIRNDYLPLMLCSAYVIFVKFIGPSLMRNRQPFGLKNTMIVYNFSLVATYLGFFINAVQHVFSAESQKYDCKVVIVGAVDGPNSYFYWGFIWLYVVYLLKYVEFLDTVFFVLRKKDHLITNLHVIHHTVVPIVFWTLFRTEVTAFHYRSVMVNSFVHVVMYTYYGLAALGPKYRKYLWWKRYLTLLQMGQLVFILAMTAVILPLRNCHTSKSSKTLIMLLSAFFFFMFLNFFLHAYVFKKDKSTAASDSIKKLQNGRIDARLEILKWLLSNHVGKEEEKSK